MSTAAEDPRIMRGMEALLKLRQKRLAEGDIHLGWKVGFGAPASMANLGIDAPLVGFLTRGTLLPNGATVSISSWTKPAFEPEIAVYLGSDLPPGAGRDQTRAAIASLGPAIELADINFAPDDIEIILVGAIFNRHVILGEADATRAGCVLDGLVGHIARDGVEMPPVTEPEALTGDLVDITRHVADVLAACGEVLRAGDVIITGSIIPPLWLGAREVIRYTLDPIDRLSLAIEP